MIKFIFFSTISQGCDVRVQVRGVGQASPDPRFTREGNTDGEE